ncbi:cytochrome P450 family protein [Embleya scabrispora]|uniref:cytochrome P450 family protein n=1 Tax=Embleya scabrispora TaxID=159449 RepID=UPI00036940D5|nr:cytochrome P450 [Embleya scabrispora]MYS78772.1 cytochrome P450 [Streptomyces sp. SID5474]
MAHDPHGVFARMREAGPVHAIVAPDGSPAWLVTRNADVQAALGDPRFSLDKRHAKPGGYQGFELPPALDANLLNMDPPDHTRLRRLAGQAFTPRHTADLRPRLERTVESLADDLAGRERVDLVADFASPFAVGVICELLGVPAESRSDFRTWTNAVLGADATREGIRSTVREMYAFFVALLAAKRADPGPDLLSALIAARDAEDRLSEDELTSLAFLLLFAGYENSANLMAGALYATIEDAALREALRADPAAVPVLVEEVARHMSPALLAIRRFPLEDIELGGVTIPAGDTVFLSIASANRDPRRYARPDRIQLDRPDPARHLSFGQGIHYCIGAPLARLEAELAVRTVLTRFPKARRHAPISWQPSVRVRGLSTLPVELGN